MRKCDTCYTNDGHHDLVCQKPRETEPLPESAGWVDADVLPKHGTMVIANCTPLYGDPYVTGCYFERGEFYDQGKTVRVSHWMAMPNPPNGRDQRQERR